MQVEMLERKYQMQIVMLVLIAVAFLGTTMVVRTSLAAETGSASASSETCSVAVEIVGRGSVIVDPDENYDDQLRVEMAGDRRYIILENSTLKVTYSKFFTSDGGDQFAIKEFRLKNAGDQDQVTSNGSVLDAGNGRGPLKSAEIIYDDLDRKTVRMVWERQPRYTPPNRDVIQEVSIFPNSPFLEIKYVDATYGYWVTDIADPGGTTQGTHYALGGNSWLRGYVTSPGYYYNRYPGDGVDDPADGGSLNYKNYFILGVYNSANGVGIGRAIPIADTRIIKLLQNSSKRQGFEFWPPDAGHAPYVGYLYGITGGGEAEIAAFGKQLVDGDYGNSGHECGQELTLTAEPDPGWAFDAWSGGLTGSQNPTTLVLSTNHTVTATFVDAAPPTVSGQDPAPGATDVDTAVNVVAHVLDDGVGVNAATVQMWVNGVNVSSQLQITGAPADYTLTYDPVADFANESTVTVSIKACDLQGNCMPAPEMYTFTIEALDETPPVITGVQVTPGATYAIVRWKTDEPATSRVDYGLTTAYGSDVSEAVLVTNHSVYIAGLTPQTLYHFQISSADEDGNAAMTTDDTFTTQALTEVVSDDFNVCALDPMWQFVNPLGDASYTLTGAELEIAVPAGVNHDVWPAGSGKPVNRAPRIMQAATGFESLLVKFSSGVNQTVQMQGVIIEQDADNFLRINVQYDADNQVRVYAIGFASGENPRIIKKVTFDSANLTGPLYLAVNRIDEQWEVFFANNEVSGSSTGKFTFPLSVTQVGAFAGNASATPGSEPGFTAVIDYFFNNDAPIDPEDGTALLLPVEVFGSGSVTKVPECGNPVTLTAVPNAGWEFTQWVGSPLNGQTNPVVTTAFDFGDAVTAVFSEITNVFYTLDVQIVGGGSVSKNPNLAEYPAGSQVTLTAQPAPGNRFASWAGDLSGEESQVTLTMDGDKQVIAIFNAEQYNVNVQANGPGQVTVSPAGPYGYNQEITITSTPNAGAFFGGWGGDLAIYGAENPLTLNVTDNIQATALFTTNSPPTVVVPFNSVSVEPGQTVSFVVVATDPDGTIPTLMAQNMPAGANFTDNGDGTGRFSWTPGPAASGPYRVTFTASDGVGSGSALVTINVNAGATIYLPIVTKR